MLLMRGWNELFIIHVMALHGRRLCVESLAWYYQRLCYAMRWLGSSRLTLIDAAMMPCNLSQPSVRGNLCHHPYMDDTETMIMQMKSGPRGDVWIRKDGPKHHWIVIEREFIFYSQHIHERLMLLSDDINDMPFTTPLSAQIAEW